MREDNVDKNQLVKDIYDGQSQELVRPRPRKFFIVTLAISVVLGLAAGYIGSLLTKSFWLEEEAMNNSQFDLLKNLIHERLGTLPFDDYAPNAVVKAENFNEIEKRIYYTAEQIRPSLVDFYAAKAEVSAKDVLDGNYLTAEKVGSGFALTSDGWIMTTSEVVGGNKKNRLAATFDGGTYMVNNIIYDSATAAVFIKIDAKNLPALDFSDSQEMIAGQTALTWNRTAGLIVNNIRSLNYSFADSKKQLVRSSEAFFKYFLLDKSLAAGDIGSPLVNLDGRVVGIVGNFGGEEAKFAIPANQFRDVIENVLKKAVVARPSLGVNYLDMSALTVPTDYLTQSLNLPANVSRRGALVYKNSALNAKGVIKNSSAEAAGLLPGDLILEVNSEKVDALNGLTDLIMDYQIGEKIELNIIRNGKSETVAVELK